MIVNRPALEVADLFRQFGVQYKQNFTNGLHHQQSRVMRAIEQCRTAALGGHREQCDRCGHERISYNSCRNRHCPKCQSVAKAEWLQARREELLPVDYFHVVFTLPSQLASLALQNKRVLYNLLFQAVSKALLIIAADPKHLGAKIGFLAILHTWGQNLLHHPHIHCVVPAGGLQKDQKQWISCRKGFFLPVRVLSRLFRRLFLDGLQQAFDEGVLQFHGKQQKLARPKRFQRFIRAMYKQEWVVYSQAPFAGPQKVLDYLSRYTHRIAFSNHRFIRLQNDLVTFRWKDYRKASRTAQMSLSATEFIRRFLLHVLPNKFVRIRYYGLFANRYRKQNLADCRKLLDDGYQMVSPAKPKPEWNQLVESWTGINPLCCPICQQGQMVRIQLVFPNPPFRFLRRAPPEGSWNEV